MLKRRDASDAAETVKVSIAITMRAGVSRHG
jgi:hypothetical protein